MGRFFHYADFLPIPLKQLVLANVRYLIPDCMKHWLVPIIIYQNFSIMPQLWYWSFRNIQYRSNLQKLLGEMYVNLKGSPWRFPEGGGTFRMLFSISPCTVTHTSTKWLYNVVTSEWWHFTHIWHLLLHWCKWLQRIRPILQRPSGWSSEPWFSGILTRILGCLLHADHVPSLVFVIWWWPCQVSVQLIWWSNFLLEN